MARKRFQAQIQATDPADNVRFQRVEFKLNGQLVDTQTVGPDGGEVFSADFDVPDNQANTFEILVTPVDFGNLEAEVPAIASQTTQGTDTIPPKTPPAPTFQIVDPESAPTTAPASPSAPA